MAEFPSLPLFTDAWIADTRHLRLEDRCVYMDMLCLMWRSPGCKVPNDVPWIVSRLCITEKDVTGIVERIISEFCKTDGNRIFQKRLLEEYEYCKKQSVRRKGKKNKDKDANRNVISDSAPNPNPNPNPLIEELDKSNSPSFDFDTWFDHELWLHFPRRVGKGQARKAAKAAIKKTSPETIIAGVRAFAASAAGKDEQYIAHPATWLNGERWSDIPVINGMNGHANGSLLPQQRKPQSPAPINAGEQRLARVAHG